MIDQKTVCVITPTRDGQVCTDYAAGIATCCDMYSGLSFVTGMSVVSLARNLVVHAFLKQEQFEHLVMIDSDIGFTRQDFMYLMEDQQVDIPLDQVPQFGTHAIVVAEYGKRLTGELKPKKETAQFGLGFARVHRSVFTELQDLQTDSGELMVNPFFWHGEMVHDYFPCGATPQNHWMSEDHGFFMLCQVAGIKPRVETRTALKHWGRAVSFYNSPSDLRRMGMEEGQRLAGI